MKYDGSHLFSCGGWLKRGSSRLLANSSSLVRHQRLPLMAEREGAGRGIVGRQRRGRSAGQLKGPLNPNLYLMSKRGEQGSRAGWGRPAPIPRSVSTSTRQAGQAPLPELGIWLHKADLSLQSWGLHPCWSRVQGSFDLNRKMS